MNRNGNLMKLNEEQKMKMNIQFFAEKAGQAGDSVQPTSVNILNMVRQAMPYYYQERIPEATSDNLSQIFDTLMTYQTGRNALMEMLPTLIGIQTLDAASFRNPLAQFKSAPINFGKTDEEIYANMTKGAKFDAYAKSDSLFKWYESYVMACFHEVNFMMQYPFSIQFNTLRDSVMSKFGIRDMMSAKMMATYAGAEWDEFLVMKQMVDTAYDKQIAPAVNVKAVTDKTTAEDLVVALHTFLGEAKFPNPANNIAGATSSCEPRNMIFMMTPSVNARISIQTLATLYNLSYAETEARTIIVDSFAHSEIQAVALDIRFFRCRNQFREISYAYNSASLFYNYFLTLSEQISASPFYPMRIFTSDTVGLESIAGKNVSNAKAGTTVDINVTETAGGNAYTPKLYNYEITSEVKSNKTIILPGTNKLIIGDDETAFPITVKVTYRNDSSVTANVTVSNA